MRLSLIMRRPVHEVMTWPLWVTRVYAEFLSREPLPEERIELGLAQLTANYVAVHRAPGSPAPRPADFLLARDAWRDDAGDGYTETDLAIMRQLLK